MFDRRLLSNFDWYLLLLVQAITGIGLLSIHSASQGFGGATVYWTRQLTWVGVALVLAFLAVLVDFRTIGGWSYVIQGVMVAILGTLILFDGSGSGVNRWFNIGPVAIQPSEFAKLTTVLAVAYHLRDSGRPGGLGLKQLAVPVLILLVPVFLIVRQPDLGTAVLLLLSTAPVLLLAGIRIRLLLTLTGAALIAVVVLVASFQLGTYRIPPQLPELLQERGASERIVQRARAALAREFSTRNELREAIFTEDAAGADGYFASIVERSFRPYISHELRPYQQKRLLTFLDPDQDPLGAGYHVIQSKIAIGSGAFWGKGYGNSTQGALNFLPARHTDFLFSIYAEEWGFAGALVLMSLYGLVILRGLLILYQTRDRFSAFLIMGVVSIVTAQVLVNIGMVVGLLPVVGVPLPFFSYGGSSMVSLMIGVALILNIRMRRFLWT
ncbi:MAG: rod shape-determining protein RodA [SAR324 cluster bacterium]|nr:rod shape-determining protein RodA [SAR324 cluster bacterium]